MSVSTAWTSRKSRLDAPGNVRATQVLPPSVVRRQVPSEPLTQAMSRLTTLSPRSRAFVPLSCGVHWAEDELAIRRKSIGVIHVFTLRPSLAPGPESGIARDGNMPLLE